MNDCFLNQSFYLYCGKYTMESGNGGIPHERPLKAQAVRGERH